MIRTIQNSYVSGEIAPSLHSRHDLKAYFQGAQRIDNFIVRKAGGLRKRQGTDIALDLTGFESARILPFFYDRTRSTLILLQGGYARFITRQPDGSLAIAQAAAADYTVAVPWSDDALPSLKSYQLGDTIYLSAPGYRACKLVRYADTSWTLTYLTGVTTVPAPTSLAATPSAGFETGSGYVATRADYALYAVKDGVISQPKKTSAAITLPWASGAQVSLAWSTDLASGVDGYLLGKKSGAYYGLLAECYPTRDPADLTSKTFASSGVATGGIADLYSFAADAAHATSLRATNPNAKTSLELKLYHSDYCIQAARVGSADPYVELTPSTSKAIGKIVLHLGAYAARYDKQDIVTVDHTAAIGVTFQRWTGSAWTATEIFTAAQAPGAAAPELTIADTVATTYKRRLTFTGLDPQETGVILRGIAVYDRAATPALVTFTATLAARTDFYARGVSGHTLLASAYTAAYLDVTSTTTDRSTRADKSCSPKRYLSADATPMAVAVAADTGSYYATVRLTASAPFRISEFRLYLGSEAAAMPLRTPGDKALLTSNTAEAVIQYTNGGGTWTTLQVGGADVKAVLANQHTDEPISITVPDDETTLTATGSAVGWGLRIKAAANAPVILRGCALLTTNIQSTFIDQNHAPTTLIDSQTYIAPGSSDMEVDVVGMHQQRLALAASSGLPFTLWFSKAGEIGMWYASRPMVDTDCFSVTIPATRASRILHMLCDRRLVLFTEGGIYVVEGSESEGFSYRTCRITKVANAGGCPVEPVQGTNTVLYVAEDARTLYELRYDLAQDGLIPIDRSVLASHLTEASAVKRLAWAAAPDSTVWALLADGSLLAFTYLPEHEVYAWSRATLPAGVTVTDIISTGSVETTVPDAETSSKIYLVATDGTRTLLLKMRPPVSSDAPALTTAAALDLCQPITVDPDGTVGAFHPSDLTPEGFIPPVPYAAGAAVVALDIQTGAVTALASDADGYLAPALAAGSYLLGIPVAATLHTLRPELPDQNIQGFSKTVKDVLIRCVRTRSVSAAPLGFSAALAHASRAMSPAAAIAAGRVPLISADLSITPGGLWNPDGRLAVTSPDPWPCEILSVITTLDIETR